MSYPASYHAACNELVAFGAARPERAKRARLLIARALKDMRKQGRERSINARYGMLSISGHFPDKVQS